MSLTSSKDYIYDIEVLPNVFTMVMKSAKTLGKRVFEISERRNDVWSLALAMKKLREHECRMVGFNNIHYDYPVLHYLISGFSNCADWEFITSAIYIKSQEIINTDWNDRFSHVVWQSDQFVEQMDLYKIHHFDNPSKNTSLKMIEFNMLSERVLESPFSFTERLPAKDIPTLIDYNDEDVDATYRFYLKSLEHIAFRESLKEKHGRSFINHNDTKIGSDYFVIRLEEKCGKNICFTKDENGKRKVRQTIRKEINLGEIILPYIDFTTPQFLAIKNWVSSQTIKTTKKVFTEIPLDKVEDLKSYYKRKLKNGKLEALNVMLDDVQFVFGTGGIHASVKTTSIIADDEYCIVDFDVKGYYPDLAIQNRFYPEHLGEDYCDVCEEVVNERAKHAKGTTENKALKLAGNGTYGNSNNQFAPFFDSKYTMSITVNGQLLLCMFYEWVRVVPGVKLIQMNTDGITLFVPRKSLGEVESVASVWELITKLTLEKVFYKRMFVRDVNNYIAEYESGGVKRKGTYAYDREEELKTEWHKNQSHLVVPRAAEAFLLRNENVMDFLRSHDDIYDFLGRTKVDRSSQLLGIRDGKETELQRVTRYHVANTGYELVKVMPPLAKKPGVYRRMAVAKGQVVNICNDINDADIKNMNYNWYESEVNKLINFKQMTKDKK
jgi:hypothetical protein